MIDYEYANGVHVTSVARQIDGTRNRVGEWFQGSKGSAVAHQFSITGANAWKWQKPENTPSDYVQEHTDLVASIRAGKPLNVLQDWCEDNGIDSIWHSDQLLGLFPEPLVMLSALGGVVWGSMLGVDVQLALVGLKVFPVVILGGLYGGLFTPTEAAAAATRLIVQDKVDVLLGEAEGVHHDVVRIDLAALEVGDEDVVRSACVAAGLPPLQSP